MVMSDYVAVIGNQDNTEVMYNGGLEVLLVLRFMLWSFGLRQQVNWQVALTSRPATLLPFFCITSHFLTMTQLRSKYDILCLPQSW